MRNPGWQAKNTKGECEKTFLYLLCDALNRNHSPNALFAFNAFCASCGHRF